MIFDTLRLAMRSRRGLSIMEVLFAVGVLTIGLLGVAALLPVATKNATSAIENDRAAVELNNRIANDLAQIRASGETFVEAQWVLPTGSPVYKLQFSERAHDQADVRLPNAFVIDPWFLSAVNTVPETHLDNPNYYDRTNFPCVVPNYDPITTYPCSPYTPNGFQVPFFERLASSFSARIPTLDAQYSMNWGERHARADDSLNLLDNDDQSLPPSLFVLRSPNNSLSLARTTGRSPFSSILMFSKKRVDQDSGIDIKEYNAAVVTFRDRNVEIVPRGGLGVSHPLVGVEPTALNDGSIDPESVIYQDERVGYVTYAQRPFKNGGGGEVEIQIPGPLEPRVEIGGWVMLMRRDYTGTPVAPEPRTLHFSWYQIADVVAGPSPDDVLAPTRYTARLYLRGPDWLFHPTQKNTFPFYPPYPPYSPTGLPTWTSPNPRAFHYASYLLNGTTQDPNATNFGTFAVLMPDVIAVKMFSTRLD